jgi:hypothetical protein
VLAAPRLVRALDPDAGVSGADVASAVSNGIFAAVVPAVLQTLAVIGLTAVLMIAVSEAVLGRRPSVAEVVHRVAPRIWSVLGLSLLTGLIFLALVLLLATPGVVLLVSGAGVAGGIAVFLAVVALLVLGPLLWVRFAFAAPALLLEQLGVVSALRRSWRLSIGSWWRTFGILLLTGIIAGVANGLLSVPFALFGGVVGEAMGSDGGDPTTLSAGYAVATSIGNIGTVVATAVTAPFSAAVTALLYIDLRIRREGLDVALARAAAEPPARL